MSMCNTVSVLILLYMFSSECAAQRHRSVPVSFLDIHIRSEGWDDPGKTRWSGSAFIKVNGQDHSLHRRGHNVVIVDAKTGSFLGAKAFDTYGDRSAGTSLTHYLNGLSGGKIVLVATQSDGFVHISAAITAFKRLGATDPFLIDHRGSFALVGYAGQTKPTWVTQEQNKRHKGPSEINLRIPLTQNQPTLPLSVALRSEGCDDPGKSACGIAYIKINNQEYSLHGRGFNVAVFTKQGQFLEARSFDTYALVTSGTSLANYLDSLSGDKIVLIATQDEASRYSLAALDALKRLGAVEPIILEFRSSFALAGFAGSSLPLWVKQAQNKRYQGPSELSAKIKPCDHLGCDECNKSLHASNGVFHSPSYSRKYPNGQQCAWKITVSQSQQVYLMFTNFSLQAENTSDAVYVYDGENATGEALGVFYGGHPPPNDGIFSSTNNMFVIFKSNGNASYSGFQASYHAVNCSGPLGLASGVISNAQISASSQMDDKHAAQYGRLKKAGAWVARKIDLHQWLQVDLGSYITVTRVATQGRNEHDQWVKKYKIQYSVDGVIFQVYKESGNDSAKIFGGNQDADTVVYHEFNPPITARFVRLLPVEWHICISVRMELYGCQGCISPLGMENGAIADYQITASSQLDKYHAASRARLNIKLSGSMKGGWTARTEDLKQWLQVDLGSYTIVTRVATQGRNGYNQWVTKYRLLYAGNDGMNFHSYKELGDTSAKVFDGNLDTNSIVYNKLKQPITARYIRIQPVAWRAGISMRMELYGCPACVAPLGMESEAISDAQISASSQLDAGHSAGQARLHHNTHSNKSGGWSALQSDSNQWLQVDLGSYTMVTRIATQGRNRKDQWVSRYTLQYSDDGVKFQYFKEPGSSLAKIFDGNRDSDSVVYNKLYQPITVRFIRILPVDWHNHISMRMEIFGCPACITPLGMESEAISDAQISASSQLNDNHAAPQARLHFTISGNKQGGWSALKNDLNQWLQVDLGSYAIVTGVATQGRNAYDEWVTKYRLQYSDDGVIFLFYKKAANSSAWIFDGNKNSDTVVLSLLNPPITGRFIRIQPVEWHNHISMRTEFYGCPGCISALGMENREISDGQITASSQRDESLSAWQVRLHSTPEGSKGGGWSALKNGLSQWLQVDLGSYTTVTRVATQGRNGHDEWVTKYGLQYSDDENIFHFFEEAGGSSTKVFSGNLDNNTVVYNALTPPVTTRFIRLVPMGWHNHISMRMEIYGCPGCIAPLGMTFGGAISDAQISASSQLDDNHSAVQARLLFKADGRKSGGWSALRNDTTQWLQVDLGSFTKVTRVATQGRNGYDQWVTKYKLQYSDTGLSFHMYAMVGDKSAKVFDGNQDSDAVAYNKLFPPITARFVRVLPVEWHNHISMRMEIYGCPGCIAPLGMDSGAIADSQISASSQWDNNHAAQQARLHFKKSGNKQGAWSARKNDLNQWLQVDLGSYTRVTGVATQGRNGNVQWVTEYRLQYSDDGVIFKFCKEPHHTSPKLFLGNQDTDSVAYNRLSPPIAARYIRILPVVWHNHISMRIELYGCPGCTSPLGMENRAISDAQISASSQEDVNHAAKQARLRIKADGNKSGGWSARRDDFSQWLQVDLGSNTKVTRVATQGRNQRDEWVTKYRLQYSYGGVNFKFYKIKENSSAKVFDGNTDSDTIVLNKLQKPITARFVRLLPVEWHNHISMRMEIYGCAGCLAPLGMESETIADAQITASTMRDVNSSPRLARLQLKADGIKQGGWSALRNDVNQWLQVDLVSYTTVTRVATQGRNEFSEWVTKYRIQYSNDGVTFQVYREQGTSLPKVFNGNQDSDTVVYNRLSPPITTLFIRVLPIEWHNHISMRMEIYGCPGCIAALGMEHKEISDAQVSASSQLDENNAAVQARLNLKEDGNKQGGWSALINDFNQWLQVDLGSYARVTRLATQGKDGNDQWVSRYRLQYSNDSVSFNYVKKTEYSSAKVFYGNQDSDTVVYNILSPPITARYIRILPVEWHNHISMRMEIYGCAVVPTPTVCLQKTTSGRCCSIPFKYKGVTYNSCTKADHHRLWCSLDPMYKGRWGNCLVPTPTVCLQKTTSGQCCSIPFKYKGVTYNSCTKADHHRLWCSLDPVYKERWEDCPPTAAPTSQPLQSTTSNINSSETIISTVDFKPKEEKVGMREEKGSNVSAVVGPLVTFFLIAAIALAGFLYWRRRRAKMDENTQTVRYERSSSKSPMGEENPFHDRVELLSQDTKDA